MNVLKSVYKALLVCGNQTIREELLDVTWDFAEITRAGILTRSGHGMLLSEVRGPVVLSY